MKLNLGAGLDRKKGWINLDMKAYPGIQVVHDLNEFPWPFEDSSFDEIVAIDVLEHVLNFYKTMDECSRILMCDGLLIIQGPLAGSWSHYHDPTHLRGFLPDSFEMWDRSTHRGRRYPYGVGDWRLLSAEEVTPGKTMTFKLRKICQVP